MEPSYERFDSEASYLAAIDFVLAQAKSSLQIFDADLTRMQLERPDRMALLTAFLGANVTPQLRIVIRDHHGASDMASRSPRLVELLERYSHLFTIRQAPENLLHLADVFTNCHLGTRFQFDIGSTRKMISMNMSFENHDDVEIFFRGLAQNRIGRSDQSFTRFVIVIQHRINHYRLSGRLIGDQIAHCVCGFIKE